MTRGEVLSLYRRILRSAKNFRYTDRDYYLRRIRLEFDNRKELKDHTEVGFQIQVLDFKLLHNNKPRLIFVNYFILF